MLTKNSQTKPGNFQETL